MSDYRPKTKLSVSPSSSMHFAKNKRLTTLSTYQPSIFQRSIGIEFIRFGGGITRRKWTSGFKKDAFLRKLQKAKKHQIIAKTGYA